MNVGLDDELEPYIEENDADDQEPEERKPLRVINDGVRDVGSAKRGIDTLFRSAFRVNMDLTSLADSKANIMISINGLMISILIGQVALRLETNPWLYLPTTIFVVGCLVSLVFAVRSARPRIQSEALSLDDVRRKKTNILFFGNFSHLTQGEFAFAMKERMQDAADLYTLMIDDIYGIGVVLQEKYRLLRIAYAAFMIALVLGVLAFVVVFGYAAFSGADAAVLGPVAPSIPTVVPFAP